MTSYIAIKVFVLAKSEPCTAAYKCDREADMYMYMDMYILCIYSFTVVIAANDILILNPIGS